MSAEMFSRLLRPFRARPVGWAILAFCLFGLGILSIRALSGHQEQVVLPAEWEPHEAVWVSFFGGLVDSAAFEIAARVSADTPVRAAVAANGPLGSKSIYEVRSRLESLGADMGNVDVIRTENGVQVRDTGPIFVKDERGELNVVDFAWTNYGSSHAEEDDSYPFDALMAAEYGFPVISSPLVMEGGAIESNGRGTVLQVESVTLQRNPDMTKGEIEEELRRAVGARKVVWLKSGPAEDPYGLSMVADGYVGVGIGGHVDEFARFVDPRTILLAYPDSAQAATDPVMRINHERMERNHEILSKATDQDGRHFDVVKAPIPSPPYPELVVDSLWYQLPFRALLERHPDLAYGDTLKWVPTRSYLNFFVTNRLVFVPVYWKPGLPNHVRAADQRFQKIMQTYYPDREIVPIDPRHLNNNVGGVHCWTQQQPLRGPSA